jgi:hypothetical protein
LLFSSFSIKEGQTFGFISPCLCFEESIKKQEERSKKKPTPFLWNKQAFALSF